MSFWIFANFLRKKLQKYKEMRNLMAKLVSNIETYENLKTEQRVSSEEKFRLRLDIEMFVDLRELVQEDCEQCERTSKELCAARDNFMELQRMLRGIDLKKLAYYEILINEMKRQQEWKEMEEVFEQKQENREKMEKRHIVQELRRKQAELKEMEARSQQELQSLRTKYEYTKLKVEDSKNRRNQIVLSLVKGIKELENLRNEIKVASNQKQELQKLQEKRDELKKQLQELKVVGQEPSHYTQDDHDGVLKKPAIRETKDSNWKTSMIPPIIDLLNPMAFLETMKIKFNISSCFQETLSTNQNENISNKVGNEIKPILKSGKRTPKSTQDLEEQQIVTRRVRFLEPEVSASISPSYSSSILSSDMDLDTTDNQNIKLPTNNGLKPDSINESRTEVALATGNMEKVCLSDMSEPSGILLPENCKITNETKSKLDIEILDCQVINSTDKNSPKAPIQLSDILSNPSTISSTYNISPSHSIEQSAISQSSPAQVNPVSLRRRRGFSNVRNRDKSSAKAVTKLNNDFLKESYKKWSLALSKNKRKRRQIMDFDSMFLCNTSPPSEKEEDAESNNFDQAMAINGMLNFGQTAALESDEGDGNEMIFSDNEWFTKDTETIEDFL